LDAFLKDPRGLVPGTKMPFTGIPDDQERADLIAYLQQATKIPPP
jgi:cytochrome c